jgi:RimJ/RimL family protein N-acetyltransferase
LAWAVTGRNDERFIGQITAGITEFDGERWFEPAWILVRQEWGQGLATEAARAVVSHATEDLHQSRLLATVHPQNQASIRVIEKVGFSFLREAEVRQGRPAMVFVHLCV